MSTREAVAEAENRLVQMQGQGQYTTNRLQMSATAEQVKTHLFFCLLQVFPSKAVHAVYKAALNQRVVHA